MSHAILYAANATNFFNLGLGVLTDAKPPKVTQVGNSEFILEMDYPVDGKLFNQLKNGNLIKADAGPELKAQRFEIKRLQKSMRKNHVTVYAEHISYQTLDISMPPKVTLTGTAQNAMRQAQSFGLGTFKPFTMTSDITTSNSTTFTIRDIENLRQALSGVEGSILDTWGGEFLFDNYHISLLKQRGRQANAMIAYGRNLIDLEQEESILNTFTSVFPYAIWRTEDGEEEFVSGNVVHSEYVDKYHHEKVLPVEFTLDFDEEKPTAAELDALAQTYIENNDVGVPSVSIQLSHIDLAKSLEFPEYAEAETINLFDRVKIHFDKLGIDTIAKVVRTVWNVNLERYDEIEVGHVRASMADRFKSISKEAKAAKREAEDARNIAVVSANGINMTFYGPDEPIATKIGDTWFQEDGQYTITKVWNGVIWKVVSDPRLANQNAEAIAQQQEDLEAVKQSADESAQELNTAINNAGFTTLDEALINTKTLAETAETNALAAMTDVQSAIDIAGIAESNAATALSDARTAISDAQSALYAYANLQISGRNLLRNSGFVFSRDYWESAGNHSALLDTSQTYNGNNSLRIVGSGTGGGSAGSVSSRLSTSLEEGSKIIVVFFAKAIEGSTTLHVELHGGRGARDFQLSVEWQKFEVEVEYTNGPRLYFWLKGAGAATVNSPTAQQGTKVTAWSPAPEDVQVEIARINGELSSKVSQTIYNELEGTVESVSTLAYQNKEAVGLKAEKSIVDTLQGTVEKHTLDIKATAEALSIKADQTTVDTLTGNVSTMESEWTQTFDGFKQRVSSVETDLVNKASVTKVNAIESTVDGTVQRIASVETDLDSKASVTKVNEIESTVNGTTQTIATIQTDLDGKVTVTAVNEIKNTVDGTTQTISDIEGNITTIESTVKGHTTSITNAEGRIATTETTVKGIQDTVSDPETGLETQVSTISEGFRVLSGDFENLEIGDRNYFTRTHNFENLGNLSYFEPRNENTPYGFIATGNSSGVGKVRLNRVITENGWWTVSFDIRGDQAVEVSMYVDICDSVGTKIVTNNSNSYKRVSVSVEVTNYSKDVFHFIDFYRLQWANFFVKNIKVAKGKHNKEFSIAPEDTATYSQLQVTRDSILAQTVLEGEVVARINQEAGRTLIENEKLYISANSTYITGTAFMDGAVIKNGTIDTLQIADAAVTSAKILNLDVDRLVGNKTNFVTTAWNAINSNLYVDGNKLEYSHSDGSKTIMSANGLYHSEGGSNYKTNYLFDVITVTGLNHSNGVKWVTLPSIYKGKDFKAHAIVADTYGVTNDYAYFNLAMLRVVCFVDKIDKTNGRVGLIGYSYHRDIRNNKTLKKAIQCKLIVTY
ncbi:hypothetical protein BKP56_09315 [Marinilactibacillus sp. 15R]|uniref:phage tail spike protein n=1 Tax=Marinilactibacillus sp. 15R TaxID=1911586 RepID=UPI00090B9EB8|nr:phage tail spike protein [Marinilactibacillus sp. 15R]API89440.1 hypothetical protein BKP56_09315 [Marinilactibacillus sp. 15R]